MLADNLKIVQEKIEASLQKRKEAMVTGNAVTLVAVTKNHAPEVITEALSLGVECIGENRVQEAKHKKEVLPAGGKWHLIGHLQTNKARQAVTLFDLIESVDSERLLALINDEAGRIGIVQDVLLQLNIAKEEQKTGFTKEEYLAVLEKLGDFKNIRLCGLMVIAQACTDIEETRLVFAAGYRAFCRLKEAYPEVDCLSMGMSNDYKIALEHGATMIRIGRKLFT